MRAYSSDQSGKTMLGKDSNALAFKNSSYCCPSALDQVLAYVRVSFFPDISIPLSRETSVRSILPVAD